MSPIFEDTKPLAQAYPCMDKLPLRWLRLPGLSSSSSSTSNQFSTLRIRQMISAIRKSKSGGYHGWHTGRCLSRETLAPSARPRQEIGRQMHEDRGLLAQ